MATETMQNAHVGRGCYLLSLDELSEAVGLDGRLVDEDVRAATVGGDEADPLLGIEPLARTGILGHSVVCVRGDEKFLEAERAGRVKYPNFLSTF
jgi:hypothetical protein